MALETRDTAILVKTTSYTGCGRNKSPIWEDKFLFLNIVVLKFKNCITQVATFIVDTLIEPLPVLFHGPASHFGRNGSNFQGYRLLKTFHSLGAMLVYLGFEVAPEKKKLHGFKSGESRGHATSPRKETTCPGKISLRIPSERRDVWAVAPSC
jgi:hypothetical protein